MEGLLVQVTVGQKHGIKRKGLVTALKSGIFDEWRAANPAEKVRLVFLCDSFNYDAFTRQPYLTTKGVSLKDQNIISSIDNEVDQYAWELDVEKQREQCMREKRANAGKLSAVSSWSDSKLDLQSDKGKEKSKDKGKGIAGAATRSKAGTSVIPSKRTIEGVDDPIDDDGDE